MIRGYFVIADGADSGVGVIASSCTEAKSIAFSHEMFEDTEWIELRVTWQKEANVDGLPLGVVEDPMEGLKRNLYYSAECEDCPKCGNEERFITKVNGEIMCDQCEDELEEGK